MFCISNVAIFYCPWCGSQLPNESEEALAEGKKRGVFISVEPDGDVRAQIEGKAVDTAELLATLAAATKDQD